MKIDELLESLGEKELNLKESSNVRKLDNFPDLIYIIDSTGKIIDAKDISGEDLLYPSSEIVGRKIQNCNQNGVGNIFAEALEKVISTNNIVNFEFELDMNSSSSNFYDSVIMPSADKHYMILIRNITEKKKIFDTITSAADSRSDLEQVFKNAVISIYKNLDNANCVIVYLADEDKAVYQAQVGFPQDYLDSARVIDKANGLTWKTISENNVVYCADVDEDESIGDPELSIGTKSYISFPIKYEGKAVGCINVHSFTKNAFESIDNNLIDIVRKQLEVAYKNTRQTNVIRESAEKYKTLVEHSTDMIIETDITGNFIYVSPNHKNLLGYEPDELIGTNIFDKIHPEDYQGVFDEFKNALAEKRSGSAVFRYKHKDGEWKYLESKGKYYQTADGQIRGVISSADITKRKEQEEENLKIEKLDSLAILAGGIAHDFNNLLSAISGNIYLGVQYKDDQVKSRERFDEADRAVIRATDLTQQLLTFAKGGAPIRTTSSLKEILVDSTNFALRGSNVKSEFSIPENLHGAVIDAGQISQVINNMAINAKQSMPYGGTVFISAENISGDEVNIPDLKADNYVKISIVDQGCGIKEENLPKIYDPYFTTKEKGSGLGLATSYSVIKKHDGYIKVDSEIDKGTTFTIFLPAINKIIEEALISTATEFKSGGKVLLMDDDHAVREMLVHIIENLGFNVDSASHGEEALKIYQNTKDNGEDYKFVLLDITIPGGMGGKDTILQLREQDPDVKAIAISGYSKDPITTNYKDYGFNAFIAKPFKVNEFENVIQNVLAN